MNKVENICCLLKMVLFNKESCKKFDLCEQQWAKVYKELGEQTVSGILAEWALRNANLPDELRQKWEKQYITQVTLFYQLLYEQNELVKLMSDNDIPMAILKGTAAAIYYPQPSGRLMGDIDFLVPEEDFERAYQIMLKNGYELIKDEDHVDYHITLKKGKMIYEIHRKPAGMPGGEAEKILQKLLAEGLQTRDVVNVEGYGVPVLPSLQNGLVLLLHIVKHLKEGLGLRQIIDWMLYVKKELHDDKWYGQMQSVLQETKYEKLAKTVTRMCQIYLGLPEDDITWGRDIDASVCESLMELIMTQGNFGCKVTEDQGTSRTLGEIQNPIQLFRTLQTRGEKEWKVLEKYPTLKMFAWVYVCWRYLRKSLRKKSTIKKICKDIKGGNKRRELFENIGL